MLMMAKVTIGFSPVMPVFVRVSWLYVCSFRSQFFCRSVAAHTLEHWHRCGFFHILMTLGTGNTHAGVQLT